MRKILAISILLMVWCSSLAMAACVKPATFPVFDSMGYAGKPSDMVALGFKELGLMGVNQFADNLEENTNRLPKQGDLEYVMCTAGRFNNRVDVKVFDLEDWKPEDPDAVWKYTQVAAMANAYEPDKTIGFFSTVPWDIRWSNFIAGYQDPNSPELQAFRAINDDRQPIADAVDVIFPSVYTQTTDMELWDAYADLIISEARRMANGKPVYVFMLPQYLDFVETVGGEYLSGENWRHQLEFVRNLADGIVVWGYWNRPMDVNDEWWFQTLEFIESLGGGI